MSTATTPARAARQELAEFQGRLIGPEDPDYEQARRVYLSPLKRIQVDPQARTVRVSGGCTWARSTPPPASTGSPSVSTRTSRRPRSCAETFRGTQ